MRTHHLVLLGSFVLGRRLRSAHASAPLHRHALQQHLHFNFDSCLPGERVAAGLGSFGGSALNEAACREELNDQAAGAFAVIAEAVDNGTATYDDEAAARCTSAMQAAFDSCDSQTLLGESRNDSNRLFFLYDASDPECIALAARGYTRGTVKDGSACSADVECADFGFCIFDDDFDDDVDSPVGRGTCSTPAGEGEDCAAKNCGVDLACVGTDDGQRCQQATRVELRRALHQRHPVRRRSVRHRRRHLRRRRQQLQRRLRLQPRPRSLHRRPLRRQRPQLRRRRRLRQRQPLRRRRRCLRRAAHDLRRDLRRHLIAAHMIAAHMIEQEK